MTTWAPATGPWLTRTTSCPFSPKRGGHLAGGVGGVVEEHAGRARAGDDAAQRALGLTEGDHLREVGTEVERRLLEVVAQRRRQRVGVPRRDRGQQVVRVRRVGARVAG